MCGMVFSVCVWHYICSMVCVAKYVWHGMHGMVCIAWYAWHAMFGIVMVCIAMYVRATGMYVMNPCMQKHIMNH